MNPTLTIIRKIGADAALSEPNYAGNIIVNLASLPDFLRKPILKRRMQEFFAMSGEEKNEVIHNALAAGPGIPFPNFSRLLKTWLEAVAELPERERGEIVSGYVRQVCMEPVNLVGFHLDGMLEVYASLNEKQKAAISQTLSRLVRGLDEESRRRITLVTPRSSRGLLGL